MAALSMLSVQVGWRGVNRRALWRQRYGNVEHVVGAGWLAGELTVARSGGSLCRQARFYRPRYLTGDPGRIT
ncbi:hypothetical protein BTJ39_01855 [Izhakiella australiensis]|uniref:Uncharacterized protein n=1 Tax=Izhakiella australiensis TaxID=1926881 RepID=A0A1S8YSW5_9GAMM|nr:hypothetical protein [Izhakiella australiensis]OON41926.1 hypothetical protein BTJ39_01855 [Izhakiella australiensis]